MKIKDFFKIFKKKKVWIPTVAVALILIFIIGGMRKPKAPISITNEVKAEKRDIVSSITGTATILPKDTYSVTSLIAGDVVSDSFSEGDYVSKDDVLYVIDTDDIERSIKSAELALSRATQTRTDALNSVKNLNVVSDINGTVSKIHVSEGSNVGVGTPIADVYDTGSLKIKIPFNDFDANNIYVGNSAQLSVVGTSDILNGIVTEVSNSPETKDGYMKVRYVTLRVDTPYAINEGDTATATINGIACNDAGSFEYYSKRTICAKTSGTVDKIVVNEGNRIGTGQTVVSLYSDTAQSQLTSANLSYQESQLNLEKTRSAMDDYRITSPISGKVVTKNVKAGDKLSNATALTEMAVIYDMSSLKFDISVDELDINRVSLGQEVTVSADALGGKTYTGSITNISINGKTANGVTTYPVSVEITEFDDDLIPGMNVDIEVITARAENVVSVPVSSVIRNNIVYVKGEKEDTNDNAPEGFKSVTVETGVYSDEYIEIVSGIKDGDLVFCESKNSSFADEMGKMMMPGGGMGGGMGPHGN